MVFLSRCASIGVGLLILSQSLVASSPVKRQDGGIFLFSFGDSYTATGFSIDGAQPSPSDPTGNPAVGTGTFSGGPDYVELLTLTYNNTYVQTYNFGYGGATISDSIVPTADPSIDTFEEQVTERFEPKYSTPGSENAPWSSENAIFTTFFGINDMGLSYRTADESQTIPACITEYFNLYDNLHSAGARKFLVVGVPPVDRSPAVTGDSTANPQEFSDDINTFNAQLAAGATNWANANPDSTVAIYDFHAFMTTVLDDPTSYGLQDATCTSAGDGNCVWWAPNDYHTTSTFQNLLAKDMLTSLQTLGW